jgi:hypothetical protein
MIRTTTHTTRIGDVDLEERHTMLALSAGPLGLGLAYRRPTAVIHEGRSTAVPDVAAFLRLVPLLVGLLLAVRHRRQR